MTMRFKLQALEQETQRLLEDLKLLKSLNIEYQEAIFKEKIVCPLKDLFAVAEDINYWIEAKDTAVLLENMKRLPDEIRDFVEGK